MSAGPSLRTSARQRLQGPWSARLANCAFEGDDFLQIARLAAKNLDLVAGGGTRGVARQPLLAGFEEFLRSVVIQALGDPFAPAQRGAVIETKPTPAASSSASKS